MGGNLRRAEICSRHDHDLRQAADAALRQLTLGLINGAFYALLSLGLAVIFGMLNIVNFAHGALFMLGAFVAWALLDYAGHRLLVGAVHRAADGRRVRRGAGRSC